MRKFGLETIESEIRKEKAEALGRAGQHLERSLRELEMVRQECFGLLRAERQFVRDGKTCSLTEYERKVTDYGQLREQAQALRHALIIQREALGLSRHEDVDRQYPLPGPLPFMTHDDD
jgi:uncharacterized protein (DUF3084 family)